MSTNDGVDLLYKRAHSKSYQLTISIPEDIAAEVSQALAFLIWQGRPLPLNKSAACYTAILEQARAKGFEFEK